jgi:hypothetical protein
VPGVYPLRDLQPVSAVPGDSPDRNRLDRRTNCGGKHQSSLPERVLCVRNYSKEAGLVQFGWSRVRRNGKAGVRGKGKNPDENKKRAAARAKANVKRDLYEIQADRMLTLTYRENMMDRRRGQRDLQEFERRVRAYYPGWQTVGVSERQERGAIHYHLGIRGWHDVNVLRKCWLRTVGAGNVDISFKPNGKGNAYTKLGNYMSKYITKDMDQARTFGEHRYHRSREIGRRCERFTISPGTRSEWRLCCHIADALLGGNFGVWIPALKGSNGEYGYMEAERGQCQPVDG